jgi:hypothetical protein
MSDLTVGFAGAGDASEEMVRAELNDWLPDQVSQVIVPAEIPRRGHKGLRAAVTWLTTEFGAAGVTEADDVVAALKNAGDPVLVLLWGDGGDAATREVLETAASAGIPCKDLTAGMDDLILGTDTTPPPAERPRRRVTASTEEPKLHGTPRATEPPAETAGEDDQERFIRLVDQRIAHHLGEFAARLAKESAPKSSSTRAFIVGEDGQYRQRGRGRPRTGERVVELSEERIRELERQGMIAS